MARFNEVLDGFGEAVEGNYTLPETSIADLMGAYDEDTAGLVPASERDELMIANATLLGQIQVLETLNAALLANVGSGEPASTPETESSDELDEDGDPPASIGGLFEDKDN